MPLKSEKETDHPELDTEVQVAVLGPLFVTSGGRQSVALSICA